MAEDNYSNWANLTDPVLLNIFQYLNPREILNAGATCHNWNRTSYDELLWRRKFRQNFNINSAVGLKPGETSWYEEYKRLIYHTPLVETEVVKSYIASILYVTFSHDGRYFVTCSINGFVMVWNSTCQVSVKYSYDMRQFSWKFTQYAEFNQSDTLLLVSGSHFAKIDDSSGEIAVFSLDDDMTLICRILNKPYDAFGTFYSDQYILCGQVQQIGHLMCAFSIWVHKAYPDVTSEHKPLMSRLFRFMNVNARYIRMLTVATCKPIVMAESSNGSSPGMSSSRSSNADPNFRNKARFEGSEHSDTPPWFLFNKDYKSLETVPSPSSEESSETEGVSSSKLSSSSDYEDLDIDSDDDLSSQPEKYLIFSTGSKTHIPHQIGIKRIGQITFPKKLDPGPSLAERIAERRERSQRRPVAIEDINIEELSRNFDTIDHVIELHGHIIGMKLSLDHRYLYVNCRPWPEGYVITDALEPPPIAQEIDIHVIDLSTFKEVGVVLRAHKGYTSSEDCSLILLDVNEDYIASGSEDNYGYLWDRHYGIGLAKFPYWINDVAFNPKDPEMLVTVSQNGLIRVWRSRARTAQLFPDKTDYPRAINLSPKRSLNDLTHLRFKLSKYYQFIKLASFDEDEFFIRKRRKPKREKPEGLKLILKVGGSSTTSTPERSFDTTVTGIPSVDATEENFNSPSSSNHYDAFSKAHKKLKKKKKKKEKDYEKRDKKKKHRKDKKKRYNKDSSQDDARSIDADNGNDSLGVTSISPNNFGFSLPNDDKNDNSQESSHGRLGGFKQNKDRTALQKLLEYVHISIEKKDTQQFFAWPVTDQIAPGYSLVISQPMDLNSMKRNIENGVYTSLPQYIRDLQLMCRNAMVYNRPDTIYYKAAKKLLHAGLKIASADKLRATPLLLPLLADVSPEELGFDQDSSAAQSEEDEDVKANQGNDVAVSGETKVKIEPNGEENRADASKSEKQSKLDSKSEECMADEILAQARNAAKQVADKLAQKKPSMEMGFLRQKKDGSTTLAIIVPNDGIDEKTRERPVLLGSLIGRLNHGSGSLQGFREDKRNFVKTVKPLYYGAFGSYAPSYDSTFANLSKEESQLLFQTYGDETAVQYAESVLNFSKDCDYVTTMVDNLLDIMTGGDHRKTKKLLEEKKKIREEEEMEEKRLKNFMESKKSSATSIATSVAVALGCNGTQSIGVKSATVSPNNAGVGKIFAFEEPKIELNQLKSLTELGIDTGFLDYYDAVYKEEQKISDKLEQTRSLLERLHQTQYERLSAPLPSHLSQIQPATDAEHQLADKVTESLSNIIKKVPPGNIAPVTGVRKAMGIAPVPPQQQVSSSTFSSQFISNNLDDTCNGTFPTNSNVTLPSKILGDEELLANANTVPPTAVPNFDLESELREFLESDSALSSFHLPDDVDDTDKTIEQMLSAHS